jgi:hypothetical protein
VALVFPSDVAPAAARAQSDIEAVSPSRWLDTRDGGTTIDGRFGGIGRVGAGKVL